MNLDRIIVHKAAEQGADQDEGHAANHHDSVVVVGCGDVGIKTVGLPGLIDISGHHDLLLADPSHP